MTEVRDPASIIEAAQNAVGDGDYLAAERLLREAAAIQEASLGSSHPDLASTLNNLAFVYERTNKFAEAERGYRRAHAIAVASLSPGHPFIATSLKNLVEFCAAHEIPIWTPPAVRPDEEAPYDADIEESEVEIEPDVEPEPVVVTVTRRSMPRAVAVVALGVAVVIVAVFVTTQGEGSKGAGGEVAGDKVEVTTEVPPPIPEAPESSTNLPPVRSDTTPVPTRAPEPSTIRERRPETSNAPVTVLNAQLCSALEKRGSPDWQCAPADGDLTAGNLHLLHATADEREYHSGTSLVPRQPCAPGDAPSRDRESRERLSDVQQQHRQPRTRRRLESRAACGRWKSLAGRALRRPVNAQGGPTKQDPP